MYGTGVPEAGAINLSLILFLLLLTWTFKIVWSKIKQGIDRRHFQTEEEETQQGKGSDNEATQNSTSVQRRSNAQGKETIQPRSRLLQRIQSRRAAKRRRKALTAHVASSRHHMNRANQLIGKHDELLKAQYEFVVDERLPL